MRNSKRLAVSGAQWSWLGREARVVFALALLALWVGLASGQGTVAPPAQDQSIELYQAVLDLQNPWTVMCVAAHPDDEDGTTLTILRRKYGVHTVTVFSTYGEGGQNAVGPELYEELGAIRARETAEAARIQGSEPYFLGLRDFGFSKSADEAFRFWGHDEALGRMVLKIRQLRPDVIITNHDTTSGHGHHQATGRLVLEAFDAAADPRRFPEQLRDSVTTWQVRRLFVRFQFEGTGSKAAEEEAARTGKIVAINPNERDALRGTTYAEQALAALQRHATQGPWPKTLPPGGRPAIRYRLAREAKESEPLPSNAETPLDGLQLSKRLADDLTPLAAQAIIHLFTGTPHQSVLEALVNLRKSGPYQRGAAMQDRTRYQLMSARLNSALATASGLEAQLVPGNEVLIPGTLTKFTLVITNHGESNASLRGLSLRGLRQAGGPNLPLRLKPGEITNLALESLTPQTAAMTVPHSEHLYDGRVFGEPLLASLNVTLDGATFPLNATTRMDVAPAVEIASIRPEPFVVTPVFISRNDSTGSAQSSGVETRATFALRLINHQNKPFEGETVVGGPAAKDSSRPQAVTLQPNETREVLASRSGEFSVMDFGKGNSHPLPNVVTVSVVGKNSSSPVTQRRVKVVWADAQVAPNLRVGYVRSFDDTLRDSLAALNVEAHELTIEDVRAGDLSGYQTIIIDNRGYQAHPELIASNSRLLDYVQAGGTLIVFYHKTNEWNPDAKQNRPQLAPYPITLGNARVTDENANIELTEPQSPLLNYPNKISAADFAGWIQERGLYYPQTWDQHYSAPFSTRDPGEEALRGGLLAADYGRGHYIYTSMVWYRQLRAGVPGAYRMLANMISYGHPEK